MSTVEFQTPEDAAIRLELPLLGTVTPAKPTQGPVAVEWPADRAVQEELRHIAERVLLSPLTHHSCIGLMGCVDSGQRARIAGDLASVIAAERSAVLIDGDLHAAHLSFDSSERAQEGLVDVLRYGVRSPRVVAPTQSAGLSLLPVGSETIDTAGTFASETAAALFDELKKTGELLIVNGPDAAAIEESEPFWERVPGWILVHEMGASSSDDTRRLRDRIGPMRCLGLLVVAAREGIESVGSEAALLGAFDPEPVEAFDESAQESEAPSSPAWDAPESIEETAQESSYEEVTASLGDDGFDSAEGVASETEPSSSWEDDSAEAEASMPSFEASPSDEPEATQFAEERHDEVTPSDEAGETEALIPSMEEVDAQFDDARYRPPVSDEVEDETASPPAEDIVPDAAEMEPDSDGEPDPEAEPEYVTRPADELRPYEDTRWEEPAPRRGVLVQALMALGVVVVLVGAFFFFRPDGNGGGDAGIRPVSPQGGQKAVAQGGNNQGADAGTPKKPEARAGGAKKNTNAAATKPGRKPGERTPVLAGGKKSGGGKKKVAAGTPNATKPVANTAKGSGGTKQKASDRSTSGAKPAPAAVAGGSYGVHVASHKTQEAAQVEQTRLQKRGFPTLITTTNVPGKGTWFRVYVGPFGEKKSAEEAASSVRSSGRSYAQVHRLRPDGRT